MAPRTWRNWTWPPTSKRSAPHLFRSFGPAAARIHLDRRLDKVSLAPDQAIPCGLIINELVSNALKYAFPAGQPGPDHPGTARPRKPSPPAGGRQRPRAAPRPGFFQDRPPWVFAWSPIWPGSCTARSPWTARPAPPSWSSSRFSPIDSAAVLPQLWVVKTPLEQDSTRRFNPCRWGCSPGRARIQKNARACARAF